MPTKPRTTLTEDARRRLDFVRPAESVKEPGPIAVAKPEEPIVNQAFRFPKSLADRLRRAVVERKTAGVQPWSANAIAIEVFSRWLDEEEKRTGSK
jgi:hypothetical protein